MAVGLLGQSNVSTSFVLPMNGSTGSSVTVYTCPAAASYAVVHVIWSLTASAATSGGSNTGSTVALAFGATATAPHVASATSTGGAAASTTKSGSDSIILGPGESVVVNRSAGNSGPFASSSQVDWVHQVVVTGYEA